MVERPWALTPGTLRHYTHGSPTGTHMQKARVYVVYIGYPWVAQGYTHAVGTHSQSMYSTKVYIRYPWVTQWYTHAVGTHSQSIWQYQSIHRLPMGHPMVHTCSRFTQPLICVVPKYTQVTHGSPNGTHMQQIHTARVYVVPKHTQVTHGSPSGTHMQQVHTATA